MLKSWKYLPCYHHVVESRVFNDSVLGSLFTYRGKPINDNRLQPLSLDHFLSSWPGVLLRRHLSSSFFSLWYTVCTYLWLIFLRWLEQSQLNLLITNLLFITDRLDFFLQVSNECSSLKSAKKALEETILKLEVSDTVQFFKSFIIVLLSPHGNFTIFYFVEWHWH